METRKQKLPIFLTELFPVQGPAPRLAGASTLCNIHTQTHAPSLKNTYGIAMTDSTNINRKLEDSYLPKAVLDIFLLGLHEYRRNDIGIKHLLDSILIAQ